MDSKCKICRRVGEKLFLKGERCFTPKCAVARKPYPPGIHSTVKRRGLSEYGMQLKEKQKLRNLYHLRENQFSTYVQNAMKARKADASTKLLESLTLRLDNIVFEAGFVSSRSIARQLVSHGRVRVNGRKTNVPSYAIQVGDVISFADALWQSEDIKNKTPAWITIDQDAKTATIIAVPDTASKTSFNIKLIIEYYART
ncbi:MAG: hypothetical protein A2719_01225 [Candidatus Ryanbacteria bacterium RIFCSPHIGHO2_01_FULL_45_22]|uniref:Small ribosomal subunit protein uS4 n=2 Tax=Candidatus Ryaniibacteriota TaxID=1817914 RepID=A0A1G2G068_9BACT|nr:MAG: hypothetical protein A2719_01225 [Candidatus Ryanbacteria bacterium RIFCSPHIGHO2_01_FULL_45_22]OGZ46349.1 MAG: hypothetical protein A3J54_04110 [Candidatus Ryanbacteria bacterium RIFCSPHIGHO2_02_FULL_45_13b]